MTVVRHPPGRAGRLWLRRRVATAERGSDQLGRKLRVLLGEQQRVRLLGEDAERTWEAAVGEARTWQLRAGLLGGQQAYAGGPAVEPVRVSMRWTNIVGVTVPDTSRVLEPSAPVLDPAGNAAAVAMTAAFGAALRAAVVVGVTHEAEHRIATEVGLTRRRVRALERRWLPALRSALAAVEQSIEFDEQEENGRLRRALALAQEDRRGPPRANPGRAP